MLGTGKALLLLPERGALGATVGLTLTFWLSFFSV